MVGRQIVPPPRRPYYLAGVPSLPAELLAAIDGRAMATAAELAKANRAIARLRIVIRQARQRYELVNGVVIVPEPPWRP